MEKIDIGIKQWGGEQEVLREPSIGSEYTSINTFQDRLFSENAGACTKSY